MDMTAVKLAELSTTDKAVYERMPADRECTAKNLAMSFDSMDANLVAASISRLRAAGFVTSRKMEHGREQLHTKQLKVLADPQEPLIKRNCTKLKAVSGQSVNAQIDDLIDRLQKLKGEIADVVDIAEKAKQFELLMKSK